MIKVGDLVICVTEDLFDGQTGVVVAVYDERLEFNYTVKHDSDGMLRPFKKCELKLMENEE